ncbi:MAG: nuclear transport factor 2 family protein [Actinobacteria bacterium]|nr:nuclear transport factor 2 family protein [Actinomycetota bacterium]
MTVHEAVAAFAAAWNTDGDQERMRLLTISCMPDAVFVSPQGQMVGIGALSASIGEFRSAFPAAVVTFGAADEHGGFARVAWMTTWNNGQPPLVGQDFAQLGADGRIKLLVSFDGTSLPAP